MPKKITQNVNKDKLFNDLPNVHPQNSTWKNRHSNYQSCNLSEIVPIYYKEVLPGEEKTITMGMISHTTTPIAPIFNAMYTELRSFFVPMRLCADLLNGYKDRKSPWVKVFGEDNASTSSDIVVPLTEQKLPDLSAKFWEFAEDMGSFIDSKDNVFDSLDVFSVSTSSSHCNYLNLAAYELIYQRHYRNENFESATESPLYQLLFNAYNYNSDVTGVVPSTFTFERANREKDYFTGAKPFTQKGDAVKLPVGDQAPVMIESPSGQTISSLAIKATRNSSDAAGLLRVQGNTSPVTGYGLFADLKSATGVSIEELRMLIKTQELLEKDALYGSRYAESLNAHFGCCPLDLTLQDPQELYKTTITSNMQAIFQTSSTSGESSILGTIGANSTTQTEPFVILPKTKFKEHGILMICAVHKLQNVYNVDYFKPKFLFKQHRFDFYTPELNDLGYQPLTNQEFKSSSNAVVGYNEAFADYRYDFNKLHGSLKTEFPYWAPAIANEYNSIAKLYKEDSIILDKALSVRSTTAPQFYDAWGFEEICTKPMSLHSIPGMDGVI